MHYANHIQPARFLGHAVAMRRIPGQPSPYLFHQQECKVGRKRVNGIIPRQDHLYLMPISHVARTLVTKQAGCFSVYLGGAARTQL
jgi:hypothetical protein